jgi:hypothetical protein
MKLFPEAQGDCNMQQPPLTSNHFHNVTNAFA